MMRPRPRPAFYDGAPVRPGQGGPGAQGAAQARMMELMQGGYNMQQAMDGAMPAMGVMRGEAAQAMPGLAEGLYQSPQTGLNEADPQEMVMYQQLRRQGATHEQAMTHIAGLKQQGLR